MARLVYACRFEVPSDAGLDAVSVAYRDWLEGHYRDRLGIADFTFDPNTPSQPKAVPDGHSLSSLIYEAESGTAVRIRWSFPDDNDRGLRWSNEVRLGQFGDRCTVEHLIFIESVAYNIAPARLLFGSPRVVRDICARTPAYIGEMQIRATAYSLQQEGLGDFLALLTSELRSLPVVLLSPYARGEASLIDAEQLARNLAGVAVVVHAIDPEVTWDLTDEVGRQLCCFNGAARIYWPGFSTNSDPRSHRLFFGDWIEKVGGITAGRSIERSIFAVAAFRFVPDRRISDVVREVETLERQRELAERKAAGEDFWKDYERDLARLDEAIEKVQELEAENANLRANQQVLFSSGMTPEETDESIEVEPVHITSVIEAVEEASKRTRNTEFLPSAFSTAGQSPFQRPYDVFRALVDLDEIVDEWRIQRNTSGSGGNLLQHLRDRGWGKRSSMRISDTTRGKYGIHYQFEYDNVKQLFEPHITIGAGDPNSCASIHFIFDQAREQMIVAHVGKHLPNTKT